jgi:hypothetical protein
MYIKSSGGYSALCEERAMAIEGEVLLAFVANQWFFFDLPPRLVL